MRPTALHRDSSAVIDVPYKLLLSVVLMTMATAVLMPTLYAYQQSEVEHRIQMTVAEIDSAARSVFHHPGSSRTVLVDIPSSGSFHLERLTIGGDLASPGPEAAIIRWRHSGGVEGDHLVTTSRGPLAMAGTNGGPLDIEGHQCLLVLEAMTSAQGNQPITFVEVRIL